VFDYYVDEAQSCMVPWEDKVAKFTYFPGDFNSMFVNTVETTRLTYFLDSLVKNKHHVMFVGNTGAYAVEIVPAGVPKGHLNRGRVLEEDVHGVTLH